METWGDELIMDCKGCNDNVKTAEGIRAFVEELVPAIDMKAYGEPMIVHFASHDPTKGGYSLCQMIETSSITGHFVDLNGDCYINIFSCKEVNKDVALDIVFKHFAPQSVVHYKLQRGF